MSVSEIFLNFLSQDQKILVKPLHSLRQNVGIEMAYQCNNIVLALKHKHNIVQLKKIHKYIKNFSNIECTSHSFRLIQKVDSTALSIIVLEQFYGESVYAQKVSLAKHHAKFFGVHNILSKLPGQNLPGKIFRTLNFSRQVSGSPDTYRRSWIFYGMLIE